MSSSVVCVLVTGLVDIEHGAVHKLCIFFSVISYRNILMVLKSLVIVDSHVVGRPLRTL